QDDYARADLLEDWRSRLEDELRFYQTRFRELSRRNEHVPAHARVRTSAPIDAERARVKRAIERVRGRLKHVDAELKIIERRVDQRFHPFWGSLLKEESQQSSFGAQVEEYACLYTAKVSDFLLYSPQQYFRGPRDQMAHELG
ncbi:MAG: 5'-nucleotidase domain-containing protein, partial [Polyangiaceae bacterium]